MHQKSDHIVFWVVINSIYITLSGVKLLFFLRLNERFVTFVELIFKVFYDVVPFTIIFFSHVVFFSLINIISGSGIDGGDYTGIHSIIQYPIQIYRNSFGDVAVPETTYW